MFMLVTNYFLLPSRDDADFFRVTAIAVELDFLGLAVVHDSGDGGVERVISSAANVFAGEYLGAALTEDNLTGSGGFTVGLFDA